MNRLFIYTLLLFIIMTSGCGSKFSRLISESWSENYALADNGGEASQIEINDGDLKTWGVTKPPSREYAVTLPEERRIDRIVVYSGNVIAYKIFCWNSKTNRWELVAKIDSTNIKKHSEKQISAIPRFDHRIKYQTNKVKLVVDRTSKDGFITTRSPSKTDKVINHRTEYIQIGRDRVRIDLYDIYVYSVATIREIEVYSHAEKPKSE